MLEKNRKSPKKNKLAPSEIENRGASPIGQGQRTTDGHAGALDSSPESDEEMVDALDGNSKC